MPHQLPEELRVFEHPEKIVERIEPPEPKRHFEHASDLPVSAAARLLSVHPNTLKRMLNLGVLGGVYRIGSRGDWRVPLASIDAYKSRGGTIR